MTYLETATWERPGWADSCETVSSIMENAGREDEKDISSSSLIGRKLQLEVMHIHYETNSPEPQWKKKKDLTDRVLFVRFIHVRVCETHTSNTLVVLPLLILPTHPTPHSTLTTLPSNLPLYEIIWWYAKLLPKWSLNGFNTFSLSNHLLSFSWSLSVSVLVVDGTASSCGHVTAWELFYSLDMLHCAIYGRENVVHVPSYNCFNNLVISQRKVVVHDVSLCSSISRCWQSSLHVVTSNKHSYVV